MARIIDADEFERFLMNLPDEVLCEDCCYVVVNEMRKQPTIEAEPVKQEWISVKDRLPEGYMRVLTYSHADGVMIGSMDCDGEFHYPYCLLPDEPTHWMPLPEPPKEEE